MAIAVAATRQVLADAYKTLSGSNTVWISVHTGSPGGTGANEAGGGTPAYARKQCTWTSGTGGVLNGSPVTIDLQAGTYTYIGLWKTQNGVAGSADFLDQVQIAQTQLGGQGQLIITPTFTQT